MTLVIAGCGEGALPVGRCYLPAYDNYGETVVPYVVVEGHRYPYPVAPAPVLGDDNLYTEYTDCLVALPNDWGYWAWSLFLPDGRKLLLDEKGHLYALNAEGVPVFGAFSLQ